MDCLLSVHTGAKLCPLGQWPNTGKQKQFRKDTKTFLKLFLEEDYINYENALSVCHLETLEKRRKILTLTFAQTSLADGHFSDLFPVRNKAHTMKTRTRGKFKIFHANTERFRRSPILTMQRMLNKKENQNFNCYVTFSIAVLALFSGFISSSPFSGFSSFQRFQHFLAVLALVIGFSTSQRFQHFVAVLALFSGFSPFQRFLALFNVFLHLKAVLALFCGFRTFCSF